MATVTGGMLSVFCAWLIAKRASAAQVHILISYAVGALLGAVFIELLPHAFMKSEHSHQTAATLLAGLLLFFILEKMVLWRHCHLEQCEAHLPLEVPAKPEPSQVNSHAQPPLGSTHGETSLSHSHSHSQSHSHSHSELSHDNGRSGLMILIGDTFHNFVDGILIAAAFLADTQLGIVTSVAIITHEVPQEVSNFLILIHSGYSRKKAFALNLLSSGAMVIGGVLSYFALQTLQQWVDTLIALASASMLYVAVADLIPTLHRRTDLKATAEQVCLIALGIATIGIMSVLAHGLE